jgi:predicted outer membrane repeat protein
MSPMGAGIYSNTSGLAADTCVFALNNATYGGALYITSLTNFSILANSISLSFLFFLFLFLFLT